MTTAIGYVRVSTDEQSEHGVSLAAQEAKLRAYCDLYNITLVRVVVDAGESGKSLNRPGLQDALRGLDRREADGIIIAKLDRLSRNVSDWNTLVSRYFGEKPGKQLWSVADSIDTRTAAGRMVLNILMTVAQWERETIAERTTDALQYKRRRSEKTGGAVPFGFQRGPDKPGPKGLPIKTLVPCPAEQDVIANIRSLRASGMTLAAICDRLNSQGITRREGAQWEHSYVSRLISKSA